MIYLRVRMLILTAIAGLIFTGCASDYYSKVPEPFTTNFQTQKLDNQMYAHKLQKMVDKKFPKADLKIVSDHFNVLIAGQVDSLNTKDAVVAFIQDQKNIGEVYDYTTIAAKPSYSSSSSIVSEVEDRLSNEPDIDAERVTVAYVDGVVYLMGTNIGNLTHLIRAIRGIYAIDGVKKVVNLVKPGQMDYYSGQ